MFVGRDRAHLRETTSCECATPLEQVRVEGTPPSSFRNSLHPLYRRRWTTRGGRRRTSCGRGRQRRYRATKAIHLARRSRYRRGVGDHPPLPMSCRTDTQSLVQLSRSPTAFGSVSWVPRLTHRESWTASGSRRRSRGGMRVTRRRVQAYHRLCRPRSGPWINPFMTR